MGVKDNLKKEDLLSDLGISPFKERIPWIGPDLQTLRDTFASDELPDVNSSEIRINVPPLTEERRKEFCKLASKYAEEGKVALRNIRREAIDRVKKSEKDGDLSEDQSRDEQETIQKETDNFIKDIEKKLSEKEAEILKV